MKTDDRIERYCKYCEHASSLSDPDSMLCRKIGVVGASHCCRRFRYDPLKRVPKRKDGALEEELEELEFVKI